MSRYTYRATDEDPSIALAWLDRDGNLIDLSTATFSVELVDRSTGTAALTKTTNVTGAATSPNVTIAWATGELAALSGTYALRVMATISGRQRTFSPSSLPLVDITA